MPADPDVAIRNSASPRSGSQSAGTAPTRGSRPRWRSGQAILSAEVSLRQIAELAAALRRALPTEVLGRESPQPIAATGETHQFNGSSPQCHCTTRHRPRDGQCRGHRPAASACFRRSARRHRIRNRPSNSRYSRRGCNRMAGVRPTMPSGRPPWRGARVRESSVRRQDLPRWRTCADPFAGRVYRNFEYACSTCPFDRASTPWAGREKFPTHPLQVEQTQFPHVQHAEQSHTGSRPDGAIRSSSSMARCSGSRSSNSVARFAEVTGMRRSSLVLVDRNPEFACGACPSECESLSASGSSPWPGS